MFGRITFHWFSVEFELEMGFALEQKESFSKKVLDRYEDIKIQYIRIV
jgi:hypothetical protein